MFTLRKVWFRAPIDQARDGLDRNERHLALKNLAFYPFEERRRLEFYFSPMSLISETARTGTLGGTMVFFDTEAIPVLPDEVLEGIRSGALDLAEVQFDVDPETVPASLPTQEKRRHYSICAAFAICFNDLVVRVGSKEEMDVALEAFNAVVAACEAADYLEDIEYSHLFDHAKSGCNWMGLDVSISP